MKLINQCGIKKIVNKSFFIVGIPFLLSHQHADAATYYVSATGNDSNSGTSVSSPVKTINKGLSKAQASGDIVFVLTGTYSETVHVDQSNITLRAYPNNKPVIDGGTSLPQRDWGTLISVNGNNNIVSGFEVKNCNMKGIYAGGYGIQIGGTHNIISNMNVHHAWGNGILLNGDYNIVEDSSVWLVNLENSGVNLGKGWGSALTAARGSSSSMKSNITSYATIRRNKVYNNYGEGLSCYEADHCIIEDNTIYDNYAVNLYLSDATNSIVRRNMIYISSAPAIPLGTSAGIALADERSSAPRSVNNIIVNNFLYNADFHAFAWTLVPNSGLKNALIANNTIVDGGLYISAGGSASIVNENSQVRNNIVMGSDINQVTSASGITFSNNNWYGAIPKTATSSTDIVGNPQVARSGATTPGNLTSAYFKIPTNSPATDAAMPLTSVPDDFFRNSRGTSPDIGAHQITNIAVDSIAPSAPSGLTATASSPTQVNLAWKGSTDNISVAGYKIYRNGKQIGTTTASIYTDVSVIGQTAYTYTIEAYDNAGNVSTASNAATVTTPSAVKLNISSYSVVNVTANSATIKWSTSAPAAGVVYYYLTGQGSNSRSVTVSQASNQSVNITGLTPNTVYQFAIWAWANNQTIYTPAPVPSFRTASK